MVSNENNFMKDWSGFNFKKIHWSYDQGIVFILKAKPKIQILNGLFTQDLQCQGLILM